MLLVILLCILLAGVAGLAINTKDEYLIKQGTLDDGSLFMYSPYFLWHSDINNKSSVLYNPLELRPTKGFLDVTFTVKAVPISNEVFSFNTRAFCYNSKCSSPAPTIHVVPGDTIKITLVNELETSSGISTAGPLQGQEVYPNRTNIFIQGLQLDPALNNPYRYTSGNGDSLVYEYTIPMDTPPGVNWYHSRVHGVAALHVLGGLHGAFIVNPVPTTAVVVNNTLSYTSSLPQGLDTIVRRVVVFSHVMLEPVRKTIPGVQHGRFGLVDEAGKEGFSNSSLSYTYLSCAYGSQMPILPAYNASLFNNTALNGTLLSDVWLTNGQYQPTLTLQPGQWHVLDIVVASGDRILELELRTRVGYGKGASACDVRLLALDGVYLNTTRTGEAAHHITLLQSGRASIAVMCAAEGKYYLQSATTFDTSDPHYTIGDFQTKSSQNLLILNIAGIKYIMGAPPSDLSSIHRPAQMINTDSANAFSISSAQGGCCGATNSISNNNAHSNSNDIHPCNAQFWLGMGPDCKPACYGPLLCAALNSVLSATQLDHVYTTDPYSVRTFPTVRNGQCDYRSFGGYTNFSTTSLSGEECFGLHAHLSSNQDALTIALARQYASNHALSASTTPIITAHEVTELTLWGHSDFAYPLFVQNHILQVGSFKNVDNSISNIVDSGEYVMQTNQKSGFYAQTGDFKETWPALTGQSKLYFKASKYTGSLLVMTSFLKYEDMGLTRDITVQPTGTTVPAPAPVVTPAPAPTDPPAPTIPTVPLPPYPILLNSDHAQVPYLCKTRGSSFYYTESVDVSQRTRTIITHSCPNHFSVCQSSECGGPLKTRALLIPQIITVPLYPALSSTSPIDTTCSDRLLGVALNGVGFYGLNDGKTKECVSNLGYTAAGNYTRELYGRTSCARTGDYNGLLYCGDAVRTLGRSIDKCGGYAGKDGVYKYHLAPVCLLKQLSPRQVRDHSPQLGWALDGFPVFGPVGAKGVTMLPCGSAGAHPVLCLDVCGGYAGKLPGYDQYLYRYYLTGSTATGECSNSVDNAGACAREEAKCCISSTPPASLRPYSIGCFRGCPLNNAIITNNETNPDLGEYKHCRSSGMLGTTADFVPKVSVFVTEVNVNSSIEMFVPEEEVPVGSGGNDTTANTTTTTNNTINPSGVSDPLFNARSILSMSPFDNVLSLMTVNSTSGEISQDHLPRTVQDAYLTGLHIDQENTNMVYYTTQTGIYSYNQATKETTTIIAGLLSVTIHGFNLGATLRDVKTITVGRQACTSIVHASPESVTCMIILREANVLYSTINNSNSTYVHSISDQSTPAELLKSIVPYTIDQVTFTTTGGSTNGVSNVPLTVVRSGSGRPVMSAIRLTIEPFAPYTLTVATHKDTSDVNNVVQYEKTLYWSNVAYGAYTIQRSRMDGSQVETVVNNVERAVSLLVLPVQVDQQMQYLYTDTSVTDTLSETAHSYSSLPVCAAVESGYITSLLTSSTENTVSNSDIGMNGDTVSTTSPLCRSVAHALFFADTAMGTLNKIQLFPINPVEVFVPVVSSVKSSTPIYTSVFHTQDQVNPTLNTLSQGVVLLQDMEKIQGFALDLKSSFAFVTALNGLVFRIKLANLLETSAAITTSTTTTITSTGDKLPVTLHLPSLLQSHHAQRQLPAWVKLLRKMDSRARIRGICVVPSVNSVVYVNGTRNVAPEWKQERILTLDTNQQQLIALTEEGVRISTLNIGSQFDTVWPHQLRCFSRASVNNHILSTVDVYLTSYLGQVWKFALERNGEDGSFNFHQAAAPTSVMDKSNFPASIQLRALQDSHTTSQTQPFFDVL